MYQNADKEQRKKELEKKLDELISHISFDFNALIDYISFSSRFNKYSNRNLALIYAQNPNARFVAAASFFKAGMPDKYGNKRTEKTVLINKGEKAMYILKPYEITYVRCKDKEWRKLSSLPKKERQTAIAEHWQQEKRITYVYVPVFDIAQTNAPAELYPELLGFGKQNDTTLDERIEAVVRYVIQVLHCDVSITDFESSKAVLKGYYDAKSNSITLSNMLIGEGKLSTLLHELGHAELHNDTEATAGKPLCVIEYEADLYSLMLCEHLDIQPTDSRIMHIHEQQSAMEKKLTPKEFEEAKKSCLERAVVRYQKQSLVLDNFISNRVQDRELSGDVCKL